MNEFNFKRRIINKNAYLVINWALNLCLFLKRKFYYFLSIHFISLLNLILVTDEIKEIGKL